MDPRDLYGLPLEQFTDRRNALARDLRREGRKDDATEVAKLRKPSLAAWAVNQLVRTQRRELDELLDAGDALQQAHADVVARRGDAGALRQAMEAERDAVERLTERARGLLSSDGHELTTARLEQVGETLHAAALDHEARTMVTDGCLERELRHIGLGGLGSIDATPAQGRKRPARDDRGASSEKRKADRRAEAAARRRLESVTRQLRTAEERRNNASERLREAEHALEDARQTVAQAEQEHRHAKQQLEKR